MNKVGRTLVVLLLLGSACGGSDPEPDDNSQVNSGNGSIGMSNRVTAVYKDGVLSGRVLAPSDSELQMGDPIPAGIDPKAICVANREVLIAKRPTAKGKSYEGGYFKTRSDKQGRWSIEFAPPKGGSYQISSAVEYDAYKGKATFKCYALGKIVKI